ncbi:hypothetical protein KJI95_06380 [Shewanella sp. JM162201]|uniref:Lipoprotein n=1 Tax=Shewanella jiangmenensis TaxID=2837387 RepID=A0ABS5V3E7_9GAMM|nr:Rcs stress response system protein RcsF [Shewanella jiangmenensis]MBT1444151.1 hypothetical protein [Shewanella jiangmenensis]
MRKYLGMSLMLLVVAGCSNLSFKTNVLENTQRTLYANTVELYTQDEIFRHQYQGLGEVDAVACQTSHHPNFVMPSFESLTKDLKLQTQKKGGNALVLHQCRDSNYAGCISYRECVGYAYAIEE